MSEYRDFRQKEPCTEDNSGSQRCQFQLIAPIALSMMVVILAAAAVFGALRRFYRKNWPFADDDEAGDMVEPIRKEVSPPPPPIGSKTPTEVVMVRAPTAKENNSNLDSQTLEQILDREDGGQGGLTRRGQFGFDGQDQRSTGIKTGGGEDSNA